MQQDDLRKLLKKVWAQKVSVEDALKQVRLEPYEELTSARVDHHRAVRCGFPEVIFCQGKRPEDIAEIAKAILRRSDVLLATRAGREAYEAVRSAHAGAEYHERARCVTVAKKPIERQPGNILVICAGTSDIPVAEEARVTAETMGFEVGTVYDAGVAGIHRLLGESGRIQEADCNVVVAGMEGALASVVGGLSDVPVIAVPTSVGYGASFGGLAPLLTMLNSCAAGVAVVNIDNGFGAGYLAALITRRRRRED
jgi:NCAIR mutase (PurE)-related protein